MAFAFKDEYSDPLNDGNFEIVDHPDFCETWMAMENLLATGKVKSIGVSNMSVKNMELLLNTAKVVPAVNQVEMHPLSAQRDLQEYCERKGITMVVYSATGYGPVRDNPEVNRIAKKHGASPAQVSLAWLFARGVGVLPKSTNAERQKDNLTLPHLDEDDTKILNSMDENRHLCWYPGPEDKTYGWTYEQLGW